VSGQRGTKGSGKTVNQYLSSLEPERKQAMIPLREAAKATAAR
jgi:hypothetical protein